MFRRINRPLMISGIMAIVLVGSILTKHYWPEKKAGGKKKFFEDKITKFCINKICVNQENGKWLVETGQTKIPANQEAADIYQKRLGEIELFEIISDNESRFAELGIGGTDPVIIEIGNKKLEIGNIAYTTSGSYVREAEGKTVYRIPIILGRKELASIDYWQNKLITKLPIYQIKKITITDGRRTETVEPKDGRWENQKLVDKIAYLSAVNFLPDFQVQNSQSKVMTVTTENEIISLFLGKKRIEKQLLYWASTDNTWFYKIKAADYFDLTGGR